MTDNQYLTVFVIRWRKKVAFRKKGASLNAVIQMPENQEFLSCTYYFQTLVIILSKNNIHFYSILYNNFDSMVVFFTPDNEQFFLDRNTGVIICRGSKTLNKCRASVGTF